MSKSALEQLKSLSPTISVGMLTADQNADTAFLETGIDQLVYKLYVLIRI